MGCALDEVRDAQGYVTGLKVSLTGRCSRLEGLRINPLCSDHLELATKELWGAAAFFGGATSLKSPV